MTTHSIILAWRIPWTEEPGGLQSIGLQRVRYVWSDWAWWSTMRTSPGKASQWRTDVERELHPPSQASILAEPHVCMRSSRAMQPRSSWSRWVHPANTQNHEKRVCCFKPLCFVMISHVAKTNQCSTSDKTFVLPRVLSSGQPLEKLWGEENLPLEIPASYFWTL